jgi:hypothetical protein
VGLSGVRVSAAHGGNDTYAGTLGLVGLDDGLGVLVERVQPLLDRLLVVVDTAWEPMLQKMSCFGG